MARKNFFELLEREIDFQEDYEKIEDAIINEKYMLSLENVIEKDFSDWPFRGNFISFWELRCHLGFTYTESDVYGEDYEPDRKHIKMDDFLLYSEMMLNMMQLLETKHELTYASKIRLVKDTILYDLEKINHEMVKQKDGRLIIVQKDAAVSAVVDLVEPDLAQIILEYHHYLLKGDLGAKKDILRKLADALEPKRKKLDNLNKTLCSDFFFLVNKMNIRHNNCDPSDKSKYVEKFDKMTKQQKEAWYDGIFHQGLMLFLTIEQAKRTKEIAGFKASLNEK